MKFWCLLVLLPLAGCSYALSLSGADEHGGTVNMVTTNTQDEALAKANEHCGEYHLAARVLKTDLAAGTMQFSCQ
jgi:hypothetical protein